MIKRFRYIYLCIMAMLACCVSTSVRAQSSVFAHYKGVNNLPYISNPYGKEMQQVHEFEYTYYVTGGSEIDLPLPFENYTTENNKTDEPKGYIRWYDYNTDMAHPRLSVYSGTTLKAVNDIKGNARGLFAWKNKTNSDPFGPSHNTVGVKYTAPTDADDTTWKGEDVACDVSRYTDFKPKVSGTSQYFTHEPTLQIRYIFHIRPAKAMAENIVKTTANDLRTSDSDLTIEDNRRIVFGAKDKDATMSVRVNYKPSNYFFYPLKPKNGKQRHLLSTDGEYSIKEEDYDNSKLYNAKGFVWYAYDETKTMYTVLISRGETQMHSFTSMNVLMTNSTGWKKLDGTSATPPTITFGSIVYLVAYAYYYETDKADISIKAPIASFEILYQNTYPKTMQQLIDDGDSERRLDYFESHYKQATKPISFDDDNDKLTVVAPTVDNNMAHYASRWDRRAYSFVYPQLRNYACPGNWGVIHGEYGIYKSANVKGISENGAEGSTMYSWNAPGNPVLYDRTYTITNRKQYGYFLYVDASSESRQIATVDFKADLCSGARLIFSAAVTDFTASSAPVEPQVLFKLYGIIKDENDKVTHQRLLTSFTSGDFNSNTEGNRQAGTWFQVYSRIMMRKNSGVENYSDFRIVIDNMCSGTHGADYAIDDIRLYIQHSKVDVLQNMPACPDATNGSVADSEITLKITSHYDNVQAITGVGKESKLFYRISDMDGNPFAGIDYNGDGTADEYGVVTIPANYDASSKAFEIDPEGHIVLVIANRHFDLPLGKKFYVSVAYPDADGNPEEWGKYTEACSSYSEEFSIVQQKVAISDANGSVVTTVRVSCDGNSTPDVDINAKLETADNVGGGSILLNNVKFDWFVGTPDGADNKFSTITGLQEALGKYRKDYPDATSLNAAFNTTANAADYELLKKYIAGVDGEGTLVLAVSNTLTGYKFSKVGTYKIAAVPIATKITQGTVTYEICPDPMYFTIRIVEDGPKLILGFDKVAYPTDDRAVRIGLPQIEEMVKKGENGRLILPVADLSNGKDKNIEIQFRDESNVFIADTNDPTFNTTSSSKQIIGKLKETTLKTGAKEIGLVFNNDALTTFHEGYWYELNFSYKLINSSTTAACPGDLFITFKVVPEYLTWFPTVANKLNANWNNDLNWKRSTAAELYDKNYEDYGEATYGNPVNTNLTRQQAYTPMKFSKVVITNNKMVFPGLGNIVYRQGNEIATKLTNFKGEEATNYIAYDFVVSWNDKTADHSTDGNGTFRCETFRGNLCDQIFFKAQAELLNQPYLVYNKAFVEKEVESNKWNLVSTPMKNIYAGDFYVPQTTGREESKTAFSAMNFDETSDNRVAAPVYQRNWDSNETQIVDGGTQYKVHDFDGNNISIESISEAPMNVESLYWSHVYNKLNENYSDGKGFALKAGDQYKPLSAKWLFRLPKEDVEYKYFKPDGKYSDLTVAVTKPEKYKLNVPYSNEPSLLGEISLPLTANTHSNNLYYIVGNPYTASLSMYRFLNGNTNLERKVWTLDNGVLNAHNIPEGTYNRKDDYIIEPMQGFFVKVKEGATVSQANFTLMMTIDRWISGGSTISETPAKMSINVVENGKRMANAKVVVKDDADGDFNNDEDIELLNNTELEDIPQVYTIAGTQAAALNTLPKIGILPFGVIAKEKKMVAVELEANRYLDAPLYILDAKTGTYTPADHAIEIEANEHGRYYITTAMYNIESNSEENTILCFSPQSGTITVSSIASNLASVSIYTIDGKLLTSASGINATSWQKQVATGIYIIKVATEDKKEKTVKMKV